MEDAGPMVLKLACLNHTLPSHGHAVFLPHRWTKSCESGMPSDNWRLQGEDEDSQCFVLAPLKG